MTAVDTNVIVRFLTTDDARQAAAARALFTSDSIWIAKTVLVEVAWVLGRFYQFEAALIVSSIRDVIGLRNVHVEDLPVVIAALALTDHGVDFADAIHVASTPAEAEFVTFDKALVKCAARAGVRVSLLK